MLAWLPRKISPPFIEIFQVASVKKPLRQVERVLGVRLAAMPRGWRQCAL